VIRKIAAIFWTTMVIIGSSISGGKVNKLSPLTFEGADKIMHFVAYMGMVLLWSLVLKETGKRIGGARLSFYASIALGILLECGQSLVFDNRSFEIMDIIANIMGSIIGLILFYKLF